MARLPIDAIYTCFHDDADACQCRKPLPGALLTAAEAHQIDLTQSYMIGDRWKDMEAGYHAGCRTIFIEYDYNEKQTNHIDYRVHSLSEGIPLILGDLTWK